MSARIDYRFKILYAVAIIMVVCGHVSGDGGLSLLSDWFPYLGMHLPIFVFCSAYFYKDSAEDNVGKYIIKKVKTLLVPLYLYNFAYGLIAYFLRTKGFEMGDELSFTSLIIAPINNGVQFIYNLGGWFIVPLFFVEVSNVLIRKLMHCFNKNIPETVFFIMGISAGLIGNQLSCMGYYVSWRLPFMRVLYFVPFYALGIFYKRVLEKYDKKIPSFWYFSALFLFKLIIIYHFGRSPIYNPGWCNDFYEGPVVPIIVGCLGIAFWMRIANIMEPVVGKSKWINLVADNTYTIAINQFMGFMLVKAIYAKISTFYPGFSDFDWVRYKTDIWWYYVPKGIEQTLIIYVVSGIVFSILVQKIIDFGKIRIKGALKLK